MVEWLLAIGGCLKDGMAAVKPEVAKRTLAEALKVFLLLVANELEDQELSKVEIRSRRWIDRF